MTTEETPDSTADAPLDLASPSSAPPANPSRLRSFLLQPFRLQTLGRAAYSFLALPLGLLYFIALIVGTSAGVPLTLVWIGFLVLAITGALLLGFISFERELARLLLGAELAPMSAPVAGPLSLTQRLGRFLSNPVMWKGAAFLLLKLPLGMMSFVLSITSFSVSAVFLLLPWLYRQQWVHVDLGFAVWHVDTFPEALLLSSLGFVVLYLALHLMNGVGLVWRWLAQTMLGSESHRTPAPAPTSPPLSLAVAG